MSVVLFVVDGVLDFWNDSWFFLSLWKPCRGWEAPPTGQGSELGSPSYGSRVGAGKPLLRVKGRGWEAPPTGQGSGLGSPSYGSRVGAGKPLLRGQGSGLGSPSYGVKSRGWEAPPTVTFLWVNTVYIKNLIGSQAF